MSPFNRKSCDVPFPCNTPLFSMVRLLLALNAVSVTTVPDDIVTLVLEGAVPNGWFTHAVPLYFCHTVLPPAPVKLQVMEGAAVYPEPGLVMITPVTLPLLTTAVPVALVPPVGAAENVSVGVPVRP